ncbi:BPSL0067 family protein, partial [Salmonella enterica]|nr:BPSL0067 family protein [Salmonella enterica]EFU6845739.1 BPSL0067 family protein [Salmonella enterica]EKG7381733.1 BPSL0067 family protein [Salmonella enterica]
MAYIYGLVDSLQGKDQVGDGECVALVKQYAHLGFTGTCKQGRKVFGDKSIPRGTAIATFVNGKYPSGSAAHKHAAFYLEQDSNYIYVMDQWKKKKKISSRPLSRKGGIRSDGTYP